VDLDRGSVLSFLTSLFLHFPLSFEHSINVDSITLNNILSIITRDIKDIKSCELFLIVIIDFEHFGIWQKLNFDDYI